MSENTIPQEKAIDFILGGNALFTVMSKNTGKRFTYKVLHDCNEDGVYKVSVLNGPDNTRNYKEFGIIENGLFTPFSKYSKELYSISFGHIFLSLQIGLYMPTLEIWHNGRCCKCGRLLTVPESVKNGIGPECILKVA